MLDKEQFINFQQLGWDFPPSTDEMFSIMPQKMDFVGYVNVSPLEDTCCNMLHAPEVSYTWASKFLVTGSSG